MAKKRLFQIFDELNIRDEKENTRNLAVSNHFVSADLKNGNGYITMGVDPESFHKIMDNKGIPILCLVDKVAYQNFKDDLPEEEEIKSGYPHIKVFVTSTKEFRAKIKESDKSPSYEVTIGGKRWEEGIGRHHEKEIRKRCQILITVLNSKLQIFEDNVPD